MKVKQLIDKLTNYDLESDVIFFTANGCDYDCENMIEYSHDNTLIIKLGNNDLA